MFTRVLGDGFELTEDWRPRSLEDGGEPSAQGLFDLFEVILEMGVAAWESTQWLDRG
jgi:hypothetical protein